MSLPTWLRNRIGIPVKGRGVHHVKCIVCHADILAGLDEDQCAQYALVDPTPLSVVGEALALIDGRRTYLLERHGAGAALWHRDRWQISGQHPSEKLTVLADHKCGAPKLPGIEMSKNSASKPQVGITSDQLPPF